MIFRQNSQPGFDPQDPYWKDRTDSRKPCSSEHVVCKHPCTTLTHTHTNNYNNFKLKNQLHLYLKQTSETLEIFNYHL